MGLKKIQEKQIKFKTKMNSRHQNPVHLTNYTLLLILEKAKDLLKLKQNWKVKRWRESGLKKNQVEILASFPFSINMCSENSLISSS